MIGIRIAEIRKQKGLTQEALAGKMEVSPKYLSSIERGKQGGKSILSSCCKYFLKIQNRVFYMSHTIPLS